MAEIENSANFESLLSRVGGKELVHWHLTNPQDTDETLYLRKYRNVLVRGIRSTTVVYLDTNFWIRLRDAEIAQSVGGEVAADTFELSEKLKTLSKSRKVICVGHVWSFLELVKQSPQSLRISSRLFDQLSDGVVIAPPDERCYWEAGEFVLDQLGLPNSSNLGYWSKIGQVLTTQLPDYFWQIPAGSRSALGKAVLDVLWNMSSEDVFTQFNWNPRSKLEFVFDAETISGVEAIKTQQLVEGKSRQAIRVESFRDIIESQYSQHFHRQLQKCNLVEGYNWDMHTINEWCDVLKEEAITRFRLNRLGIFLPFAVLHSELYSLYEFDAGRKFTVNDWADWQHAAAALPFSNIFLTEAHLAHQLKNVLHADSRYNCTIASNNREAIEALGQILDVSSHSSN